MSTVPTMPDPPAAQLPAARKNHQRDLLRQAGTAARAVKKFARANPGQVITIDEKQYPRVETWQFLGACFECTALITSTQELEECTGFLAVAHVRNAVGQIISGAEAVCMFAEPHWSGLPCFQLRSMAQTRAIAKAFRNVFAWVMVMAGFAPTPAEEVEFGRASFDEIPSSPAPKRPAAQLVTDHQVNKFEEICATNGKTLAAVRAYLQAEHRVDDVRQLTRGREFTKALQWACNVTRTEDRKPQQPALTLLDSIPAHKDAWSL